MNDSSEATRSFYTIFAIAISFYIKAWSLFFHALFIIQTPHIMELALSIRFFVISVVMITKLVISLLIETET